MSAEELAKLATDAPGPDAAPSATAQDKTGHPETPPYPGPKVASPDLVQACIMAAAVLGGVACERFKVSPLTPAELMPIGQAGADLAAQYNIQTDPKIAAWFNFSMAVMAVALSRMAEYRSNNAKPVRDANPAPASASASASEDPPPVATLHETPPAPPPPKMPPPGPGNGGKGKSKK